MSELVSYLFAAAAMAAALSIGFLGVTWTCQASGDQQLGKMG